MKTKNKKILIIIGGGISAYKSLDLIRFLKKDGYEIKDINTEQSSLEEIFIKLIKENNNELVRN